MEIGRETEGSELKDRNILLKVIEMFIIKFLLKKQKEKAEKRYR